MFPDQKSMLALGRRQTVMFLALCGVFGTAQGQDSTAGDEDPHRDDPVRLDQVVVRATANQQTIEELIQPVEVLSGEALEEARAPTLGETVGALPGVQSSNFGAGVGRPIVRGLDGARVSVLSGGLSTQDVSTISQDHGVAIEPFLADQIEVLKGPATLLFGSGAIGGVVNVEDGRIAEFPLDRPLAGRAEVRAESVNDGLSAMGRVDVAAADGRLALHADGVHRDLNDYDTPNGRQANSFVDNASLGFGASFVTEEGFAGVSVSRFESDYGNPGEPGDPSSGEPGVSLDLRQDRVEAKGGLRRDFGVFDGLRASVAQTDYEHIEFEGDEVGTVFSNEATEGRVELTHAGPGALIGAIGLQYSTRDYAALGDEAFVPRTATRSAGLFVTERVNFGPTALEFGARIDDVESRPDGQAARSFNPVSLALGGLWNIDEQWRLSLNLNRAERAPAEEELFAFGPHLATASFEIGDADLREERATQADFGVHYHGDRFEAKAALYRTRFDGFIYLLESGDLAEAEDGDEGLPVRLWSQADATFQGFELEGIAHLVDQDAVRLDARLFADRVDASFDAGGDLPRIAPARLGAELRFDADAWRASLGAVRYASQDDVAAGESPTEGYTLVDAHFAWHFDVGTVGWELFVDANNLTDEVARVHTSFLKDQVVLPGRNFAAGVRVFF